MGVIPGHIKDEVVIIGNHRDGESVYLNCLLAIDLAFYSLGT